VEITLGDEQEFFRDTTRKFLGAECPISKVRELADDPAGFEPSYWASGAELGWTCLLVAERDGGGSLTGNGVVDLTIVADAFGRNVAPGPLLPVNVVADAISRRGSDAQRSAVLPGLLSGETVIAWCGAEHAIDSSTGRAAVGPVAVVRNDTVELSGVAMIVEAASQASHFLVTARSEDSFVQLLVDRDAPGIEVEQLHGLDAVKRFGRVSFSDVKVSVDAIVGDAHTVAGDVERQLQVAVVIQVAEMVAAAEVVFGFTLEWTFDRYSFGRPLASYQEIKHRMADMKMWLEASHAMATAAARAVERGDADAADAVSGAKAYAGHYLPMLVQDCVQLHGGIGLTTDHDLHLFLRRVTTNRSLFGPPADHRRRLAAAVAAVAG
jgi:alkylation response protein AidB-like acyl-CoA dehydrogenase